ncbi:MAG: hypothetical protein ABJB55_10320 [Actinomycetota bacterium]
MLRQLWRLTEPVPAAGPSASAVAIYEHPDGVVTAKESGYEGVACVDDTARLLDVLCSVYDVVPLPWVERWARGLLDFVLWMQEPDGSWLNFVYDWDGDRNRSGITSRPGQNFWLARAIVGVGHAAESLGDEQAHAAFVRGLTRAAAEDAPPDIRSLHLLAALRAATAGDLDVVPWIRTWADELVACRDGVVLKNSAYEVGPPHLWAHIQEGVLATAGGALRDATLHRVATASAEAVVLPAIERAFAGERSLAYEVSSCVEVADRLFAATGESRWSQAAADARAWFDGRNVAGAAIYNPERGRVADGLDENRVSRNSGAESNISGAQALLDRAVAIASSMPDPFVG